MAFIRTAPGLALALLLLAPALANEPPAPAATPAAPGATPAATPDAEARQPQRIGRSIALVRRQAERQGVPADLAQAVMMAESDGDPTRKGPTGEIGLMGLRLATAMMLGFRGDQAELFDPALNASYGVAHLAQAWRIAGGDPCRAYVKYRTHYGEERVGGRHGAACGRLRTTLAGIGSPLAAQLAGAGKPDEARPVAEARPAAEPKPAEETRPVAEAKPAPEAKPVAETKPAETKPVAEARAEPAGTPVVTGTVDHPLPPARPKLLAALARPEPPARRAAPPARAAATVKPAARTAKAEAKPAKPDAKTAKPEAKPAKAEAKKGGVTVAAKTSPGDRQALSCKGRTCKVTRAAKR